MKDRGSRFSTDRRSFLAAGGGLALGHRTILASPDRELQSDYSWPAFQFDARNTGYDPSTAGLVTNVGEETQYQVASPVRVPPIVANGTVYLSSTVLNGDGGQLTAIDLESGQQRWTTDDSAGVLSTPTVAGQLLLVGRPDELGALSLADGSEAWTTSVLPSGFSSPTVRDGTAYVGTRTGTVSAVDTASGRIDWEASVAADAAVNTTPAVGSDRVYVGAENDTVAAFDTRGGEVWTAELPATVRVGPTLGEESLFVATTNGTLHALDPASGSEQWRVSRDASTASSPALADGTLYWAAESTLSALTAADGTEQWTVETSGFSGLNNIAPSPVRVGDVVYLTTGHTTAYAVDAETGAERWTFTPDSGATVLALTVTGGTAYLTTDQGTVHVLRGETNIEPAGRITFLPQRPAPGEEVTFDAGQSTDLDGTVTTYEWDLDDDGEFEQSGQRVTRTYESAGTYGVTLRITDDAGRTTTTSSELTITTTQQTATTASGSSDPLAQYVEQVPGGMTGVGAVGGTAGLSLLIALARRLRSSEPSSPEPESDTPRETTEPTVEDQSHSHLFSQAEYGDYEQGEPIGSGEKTRVVRAALAGYDEAVAFCTLATDTSETVDRSLLDRFADGVDAWSKIDEHDNVLTVHDWGDTPVPWAALELADGQFNPRDFSEVPVDQKRMLVTQLCEAIHHGHRYGLVHGALTPSNVLYVDGTAPSIRVADWGISAAALTGRERTQQHDIARIAAFTYELFSGDPVPSDRTTLATATDRAGEYPAGLNDIFETVWGSETGYETALHLRDAIERAL